VACECWADAANDLAGPELFAEEDERAIFEIADGAEGIPREGGVVGIHAAPGEIAFESWVGFWKRACCASAEGFALKTVY
jgi:hypothetical protein